MWLSVGFRFLAFVVLAFVLLLNCIAVPECKCKQCGWVRRKWTTPLQEECTKTKLFSPGLLYFESLWKVFNFECLVGRYTYELRSTFNVDRDFKRLLHSGMVVYHTRSCAKIVELVICWNLSSAYTYYNNLTTTNWHAFVGWMVPHTLYWHLDLYILIRIDVDLLGVV
jgi:hypothetical protein